MYHTQAASLLAWLSALDSDRGNPPAPRNGSKLYGLPISSWGEDARYTVWPSL